MALAPLLAAIALDRTRAARAAGGSLADRARRGALLAFIAGAVYFAGTLYWITSVMVTFGGLPTPVAVIVNVLLVLFLALFLAVFGAVVAALARAFGPNALLLAPVAWVTVELAREHLFGGFPWVLLGYSQTSVLPIAQLASLFGVYGISGLLAFVSAAAVHASRPGAPRRFVPAAVAGVLVVGIALWGSSRLSANALVIGAEGEEIAVGLIQGNVPQDQKWDLEYRSVIFERYLRMTREAAARGARFIIWPESSTPFMMEEDPAGRAAISELARATGAHLLIGSDQMDRSDAVRYYNAAFLVEPNGEIAAVYRKIHLVPFGEYVPLRDILFFASPLVESVSDFSAGADAVMLPIGPRNASTAICYEVVYPSLIRDFVLAGTELLTTITNDAWYGESSAPHQHFEQAAMRAIEQGRYLARAANTGISGIVDPYGRIVSRSTLFEEAALVGSVRFIDDLTVYGRIGDLFAHLCTFATILAVAGAWRTERASRGASQTGREAAPRRRRKAG